MVIAAIVRLNTTLPIHRAPEFSTPHHQCFIQHAALLEIAYEGSLRLVDIAGLLGNIGGQSAMLVPTAVIKLHATHTLFQQTARQQTVGREGSGALGIFPVKLKCFG